jgi:hypothetical protein
MFLSMLYNSAIKCSDYSVSDEQMSGEHFWNYTDRRKGLEHEAEHTNPSSAEVNEWS